MRSAIILGLILGLSWPGAGRSETDPLMRVEVIVFQHVNGDSDQWSAPLTAEYSGLVDPQSPGGPTLARSTTGAGGLAEQGGRGDGSDLSWPPLYVDLGEHSEMMTRALSRLQASNEHRVLANVTWLQPLTRGSRSRPVRLRGQEELFKQTHATRSLADGLSPAIGPAVSISEAIYRLDGSLTLRQRQFRHVDLDLVWRDLPSQSSSVGLLAPRAETLPEVLIHRIELSRPIGLDRLEYFDSSWLGVLVLIQEWQRPEMPGSSASGSMGAADG